MFCICLGISQGGLLPTFFSSNKSVRDARAKQELSRMQKGKPRDQTMLKPSENNSLLFLGFSGSNNVVLFRHLVSDNMRV